MKKIQLKARAKINLSLDVLGKRPDGYHDVQMIMQQIDLFDLVTLEEVIGSDITIVSQCPFIPQDSNNIAYKAAALIKDRFNIKKGLHITIDKNIPVAAGLAGGSTNAAAVLLGLNELWRLELTLDELMVLGAKLGADVPFCIMGGAAYAEGVGEILTPIDGLKNVWLVVAKPAISISTAEVYKQLDLSKISERPNTELLLSAINSGDINLLSKNMYNLLETVSEIRFPVIKEIKNKMLEYNAIGSMMSGSGPTVFGIFKGYERAKSAYENLSILYKQTYLVQSYSRRNNNE